MTRIIGFLVYPDLQPLDLVGPFDAFGAANEAATGPGAPYRLVTIGLDQNPVRSENGLVFVPDVNLDDAPALDTLIIPGGRGSRVLDRDTRLLRWIRDRAAETRRVASTCTGIYLLAATGLLNERRATTHWGFENDFRRRYPRVRLDIGALHVQDGQFFTSGGLSAGMDLALALIEADLGGPTAVAAARHLVVYVKRPGNQAQFSEPLQAQAAGQGALAGLIEWLIEHLPETITVARMADQVNMSERNFRRSFSRMFQAGPSSYLERLRMERARTLLTSTRWSVERIAARVGFASADAFGRVFRRRYDTSPTAYRRRFAVGDGLAENVGNSARGQSESTGN